MFAIDSAVIVEGKYDKIKLENILYAPIVTTDGFGVFKNKEKLELIKRLADKNGIVILTDSDSAGQMIRTYISKFVDNSKITHVYIPEILGKERRKEKPSAAGTVGVEGVETEILVKALKKAGVLGKTVKRKGKEVTKIDLYNLGLSGKKDSSDKRKQLLKKLELPTVFSTNAMLIAINGLYSYEEFMKIAGEE